MWNRNSTTTEVAECVGENMTSGAAGDKCTENCMRRQSEIAMLDLTEIPTMLDNDDKTKQDSLLKENNTEQSEGSSEEGKIYFKSHLRVSVIQLCSVMSK